MELTHQLTPKLKQLRLSGILDTLEVRTRAAVDGQWSYVEFLERLLEDEVERRAQEQLALRLRRAVEALERAGTPEASEWLEALSKGKAGDDVTEDARAAWKRRR